MYKPTPIDISAVEVPECLDELAGALARNAHDVWVRERVSDGWSYAPTFSESLRRDFRLVPFAQLRAADRTARLARARETLRAIRALGYTVERVAEDGGGVGVTSEEYAKLFERLARPEPLGLAALIGMWTEAKEGARPAPVELLRQLGERILGIGEPLIAYDVLSEGIRRYPKDVRLRQLLALALARSGATERAREVLLELEAERHTDEETLAILARTYKDLWAAATHQEQQGALLQSAFDAYARSYRINRGYYSGINMAALAALLGKSRTATRVASQVHAQCSAHGREIADGGTESYWVAATLGEAALILRRREEAAEWYRRACELAGGRAADLSTTRRQARLLAGALYGNRELFDGCLLVPKIVVCSGHMIDAPGRASPRFPAELEPGVASALRDRLDKLGAGIGYASAACGTDILFLEAMLERGGEINVVLPFSAEQFRTTSVATIPGSTWGRRFDTVLERAARVINASE
jgi:tetratricopeptide (TPR) repeat protein